MNLSQTVSETGGDVDWTTGTPLPSAVSDYQAVVTRNRVYLLGGHVDGKLSSKVYVATLD